MDGQTSENLLSVKIDGDELRICSIDFAKGLGIQHKNLLESIRAHQDIIESEFGLIAFETRKTENISGKGRSESLVYLTEDQSLFIGTLSRNSKRVVQFKSILVKSFAEARKSLVQAEKQALASIVAESSLPLSVEQVLLQQAHTLLEHEQIIDRLLSKVNKLLPGKRLLKTSDLKAPHLKAPHLREAHLTGSAKRPVSELRQLINRKVNEYCDYHDAEQSDTYTYLYRRLNDLYRINVYQMIRNDGDTLIDALERYDHLDKVYRLVVNELIYPAD